MDIKSDPDLDRRVFELVDKVTVVKKTGIPFFSAFVTIGTVTRSLGSVKMDRDRNGARYDYKGTEVWGAADKEIYAKQAVVDRMTNHPEDFYHYVRRAQ